jgi:hypothetical protein
MMAKTDKSRDPEAQIHAALAAVESAYGMRVNESCGMHVHVGLAGLGPASPAAKNTAGTDDRRTDSEDSEDSRNDDVDDYEDRYARENGGFPLGTLRMLAVLVTCCEAALNQLHPPHRQRNPYCRSPSQCRRDNDFATLFCTGGGGEPQCSQTPLPPLAQLRRLAAQKSVRALYEAFNGGEGRYFAYNFENLVPLVTAPSTPPPSPPVNDDDDDDGQRDDSEAGRQEQQWQQQRIGRGTVEFRQFAASLDAAEIVARVRVALALVAFAHRFRHCGGDDEDDETGDGDGNGVERMLAEALRFVPRWREPTAYDVLRGIGIGDLLPPAAPAAPGIGGGGGDVTGGDRALETLFQRLPLHAVVVPPRREDDMLPRVVCELARRTPSSTTTTTTTTIMATSSSSGRLRRIVTSILGG